jgi:hypothetical protein
MKQPTRMRVVTEVLAAVAALAIAGLYGTAPAQAVSPVVKLRGDASLATRVSTGGKLDTTVTFHVDAAFATDTPGAEPFTVQQAVMFFPDHAGTNGRLFPSCGARRIERFHGNIARCPKGSKIGSGTVKARAIQLGIIATGRVTMFNSGGGKSVTFNIQTNLPAYVNESLDAPLTQLHGRYGEKLTLTVPHSLQEILSGVFVGVQDFDVTLSGAVHRHGVEYTYIKARTCPTRPLHGVFDFKDWTTGQTAQVTADANVRCMLRRR